jgi:hypothetical protein
MYVSWLPIGLSFFLLFSRSQAVNLGFYLYLLSWYPRERCCSDIVATVSCSILALKQDRIASQTLRFLTCLSCENPTGFECQTHILLPARAVVSPRISGGPAMRRTQDSLLDWTTFEGCRPLCLQPLFYILNIFINYRFLRGSNGETYAIGLCLYQQNIVRRTRKDKRILCESHLSQGNL